MSPSQGRKKGAQLVELALVLVVFLLIVFGIMEFGRLFLVTQTMVNAAREGARRAAVIENLVPNDPRVLKAVDSLLTAARITGAIIENNAPAAGDDVVVTVRWPYRLTTGITKWFGVLDNVLLQRQATMYRE